MFSDKSSVNCHISSNFLRGNATSKHDDDKNTKIEDRRLIKRDRGNSYFVGNTQSLKMRLNWLPRTNVKPSAKLNILITFMPHGSLYPADPGENENGSEDKSFKGDLGHAP